MARAHARRDDQNVVARTHASIASPVAHERAALGFGNVLRRRRVQTLGQISYDGHVVGLVGVSFWCASADAYRSTDGLAKRGQNLARRYLARCEAMARRHSAEKFYYLTIRQDDFEIGERRFLNHGNVVIIIDDA